MSTPEIPSEGSAYAVPLADGRWSVCRVLRVRTDEGRTASLVAGGSWLGEAPPDASEPALRPLLALTHHAWEGKPHLVWVDGPPPERFVPIGSIAPTPEEQELTSGSFGSWEAFALQPLAQWRWDHEREAVLAEDEVERQQEVQRQEQAQREREAHLASVTLEDLLYRPFLTSWEEFVSADLVAASRQLLQRTVADLLALGLDSPEGARLAALQDCVESFNDLEADHEFIFTIEREDLCEILEEIAHAAGLGHYEDIADQWRDW